jgi:hypothetical protein
MGSHRSNRGRDRGRPAGPGRSRRELERLERATEVFPRPAAKPPKAVKVRAWAIFDPKKRTLLGIEKSAKDADRWSFGCDIIPGTFIYTPKRRKP